MKKQVHLAVLCLMGSALLHAQTELSTQVFFDSDKHELRAKSQSDLLQLLAQLPTFDDYELYIEAYTDDQGDADYNQALAERRAESVNAFLRTKNITPKSLKINALGEIDEGDYSKTMRQQNRRVEVKVNAYQYKTVDDILHRLIKKSENTFQVSNEKEEEIIGKNGVKLAIPANSFTHEDGSQVTEKVEIQLTEALHPSDWFMNNLGTMSNQEILQTGGMVKIDAVSEGKKLKLKNGKSINVTLPSATIDSTMKLFYGQHTDEGKPVNWTLANNRNMKVAPYVALCSDEIIDKLLKINLPRPSAVRRPKLVLLKGTPKPNRPNQMTVYEKKVVPMPVFTEKMKENEKQQLLDAYQRACINNEKKHRKDSIGVLRFWRSYRVDSLAYEQEKAIAKQNKILIYKYLEAKYVNLNLRRLRRYMERPRKNWTEYADVVSRDMKDFLEKAFEDKAFRINIKDGLHQEKYGTKEFNFITFSRSSYNSLDSLNRLLGLFDTCKVERKRMMDKEIANGSISGLNSYIFEVTQTGWANCDRFQQFAANNRFPVKVTEMEEVKMYLYCKKIKSFIPLSRSDNNYVSPPIPAGIESKLLALKLNNGKAYYSETPFVIANENNIKPTYKALTIKELDNVLLALND